MPKIILWKDFNFKDDSFYKKIKNIKDNSLICSFSTNLQRNFFKTTTRKGGKVLLSLKVLVDVKSGELLLKITFSEKSVYIS